MRACPWTLVLAGCLLTGCADYDDDLCTPHVDTSCVQGNNYWVDSCGRLENVLEECECGCRADQSGCRTCGEKECETNADCPEDHYCDRTDWYCKPIECTPDCTGRCCGPDGCGGTCPDDCSGGERCNQSTCRCELEMECRANADCPEGYWCDRTVWRCRPIECIPDCTRKCCGDDGCGGTCPQNCPTGYWCNPYTCTCENAICQTDADCQTDQCCIHGNCEHMRCGALQCGPDPVCGFECGPCPTGYHCDMGTCVFDYACTSDAECAANQCCINGICQPMNCGTLQCGPDPVCGKECGPCPTGEVCKNGVCEYVDGSLCPAGQWCTDLTGTGYLGCILPPDEIPDGNQTGCAPQDGILCDGNYTCFMLPDHSSVCIENCGTCPYGTGCYELWEDGPRGCLLPDGTLPTGNPTCDTDPCPGNMSCYGLTTGGTICVDNCSQDHDP